MSNGIADLLRYQTGGGVNPPLVEGEEWAKVTQRLRDLGVNTRGINPAEINDYLQNDEIEELATLVSQLNEASGVQYGRQGSGTPVSITAKVPDPGQHFMAPTQSDYLVGGSYSPQRHEININPLAALLPEYTSPLYEQTQRAVDESRDRSRDWAPGHGELWQGEPAPSHWRTEGFRHPHAPQDWGTDLNLRRVGGRTSAGWQRSPQEELRRVLYHEVGHASDPNLARKEYQDWQREMEDTYGDDWDLYPQEVKDEMVLRNRISMRDPELSADNFAAVLATLKSPNFLEGATSLDVDDLQEKTLGEARKEYWDITPAGYGFRDDPKLSAARAGWAGPGEYSGAGTFEDPRNVNPDYMSGVASLQTEELLPHLKRILGTEQFARHPINVARLGSGTMDRGRDLLRRPR